MDAQAELVARARGGERAAVDELVRATKDLVYNLAIRMLGHPADAEDATQEILMKIVSHLSAFRGESAFRTWAYRVASNHLLTTRKRGAEQRADSFDALGDRLEANLADGDLAADDRVLVHEAKMMCSTTMLACLDRDHRLAFILGECLEVSSDEGATILEIAPDAFRKRLSRARERMTEFMSKTCGLVNDRAACRCGKQATHAVRVGMLDPSCLPFASVEQRDAARALDAAIDDTSRALQVFRRYPDFIAPSALVARVRGMLGAAGA